MAQGKADARTDTRSQGRQTALKGGAGFVRRYQQPKKPRRDGQLRPRFFVHCGDGNQPFRLSGLKIGSGSASVLD